jgi:hypothetical protein
VRSTFLALAFLLAASSAAAAAGVSVTVTAQADSPVTLMTCTLQKQFVTIARGVSVEGFRTGVTFKNTTQKPIARVVFTFLMRDATGVEIDSHTLQSVGAFAPDVEIDNISWNNVDNWPTLGDMDCSIQQVIFQDGSSWNANSSI